MKHTDSLCCECECVNSYQSSRRLVEMFIYFRLKTQRTIIDLVQIQCFLYL